VVAHEGKAGLIFWLGVVGDVVTSIPYEHLAHLKGGEQTMNKYVFGLALGIVMSVAVILTNVVFPNEESDSEYGLLYAVVYLGLLALFGVGGYLASKSTHSLRSGAVGGAVTALLSIGLTMLTFIIIDNLFLDIVSQQPDKLWGFQHQQTFHTMRGYVNDGLLRGVLYVLPVMTLLGALLGTIGASVRKLWLLHS
jgi:MFS family permease